MKMSNNLPGNLNGSGRVMGLQELQDFARRLRRDGAPADRVELVEDLIEIERGRLARNRARNADFSWVRPILSGRLGEAVLDE